MPDTQPVLTIAIPTFNRAHHLQRLLDHIAEEVNDLGGRVHVIVSDNASDDHTPDVVAKAANILTSLTYRRHPHNLGADENFCSLVDSVTSGYFWILGDDDLPRRGSLEFLVTLIDREQPDSIYLRPQGLPDYQPTHLADRVGPVSCSSLGRLEMVRRTNVYTTFVSSWVIRKESCSHLETRRFVGTLLVQLGWVLGTLREGQNHVYVNDIVLYGLMANSGGYAALDVFTSNLAGVARAAFGDDRVRRSSLSEALIKRSAHRHLPWLVLSVRNGTAGGFDRAMSIDDLNPADVGGPGWRQVLHALMRAPRPIATALYRLSQVLSRVGKLRDRASEVLSGRGRQFVVSPTQKS